MNLIGALNKAAKAGETVKKAAPFYSAVDEALGNLKRPKGTGIEFLTEVLKQPGVKKAEIADRKLEQAFKAKGKMTKEEAQNILARNPPPKLQERVLEDLSDTQRQEIIDDNMMRYGYDLYDDVPRERMRQWENEIEGDAVKYGDYQTPGGENYREILLKLPQESEKIAKADKKLKLFETAYERDPTQQNYAQMKMAELELDVAKKTSTNYKSQHWDDPNVLAHIRVQDRKGANGEKILHVEEIQSDWHQEGRKKGYATGKEEQDYVDYLSNLELRAKNEAKQDFISEGVAEEKAEVMASRLAKRLAEDPIHLADYFGADVRAKQMELNKARVDARSGIPDAPFKKNWHELAMKRLLNYAADNGYDSIAITPGAEQAKRYDLSKQINTISWNKQSDGLYNIEADAVNGRPIIKKGMTEQELENTVGKEVANRIVNGVGQFANDPLFDSGKLTRGKLENLDLQVGGEGMKGFYDKMLPDYLNNYGKSYGAKVEMDSIPVSTRDPKSTSWGGGQGDHPFMTSQDLSEPFDGMVDLMRRNPETGEHDLVGRMLRADSERRIAQELQKLDTYNQIKLHNFPITPEMRESIKQKGLPLYQQVGIPTAGAGAASQAIQPEEELGLSGGGSVAKLAALAKMKKLKEEMAPRAEAVKALIARDQNRYLGDVVPNSLTNAEIEAEMKRMAAKAPIIMKPSALTELRKIVQQEKGDYGSRRLERAADEIPNLEKLYKEQALKETFTGDNARALMTMNPKDFEKYAVPLDPRFMDERSTRYTTSGKRLSYPDYMKDYLPNVGAFNDVPFLLINKQEQGLPLMPFISGHEGRHRNRVMVDKGEEAGLVQLMPRAELREPFPRRSQEEYIDALKQELEMTGNMVTPEQYLDNFTQKKVRRSPIILPDIYAKGGAVKPKVKKADGGAVNFNTAPDMSDGGRIIQGAPFKRGGKVNMTTNRDTMFMELSNKKLKRK
jgi:hypothetical protein